MYRKCTTAETGIGMRNYLCDADGTGGRLKTLPEDFVVREISDPPRRKDDGDYSIATVTAKNWETNRMVRLMSRSMGVSRDRIGFAGTKDKRAVTTQLMSVYGTEELWKKVGLKDIGIENVYRGARGIEIGDLIGNDFEISVRNCTMEPPQIRETVDSDISVIRRTGGFPNYFGVQRFGAVRPVTHLVGERLVRGDIQGAVMTYISFTTDEEEERLRLIRERFRKADVSEWGEIRRTMPPAMAFERMMLSRLIEDPEDWVGAIDILPTNLQMMFVHAYQSWLFNEMLSRRMDDGLPLGMPVEGDIIIPLDANRVPQHENPILTTSKNIDLAARQVRAGRAFVTITLFGSDGDLAEGEMGEIERKVIEENGLSHEDFIIPELPRCTSKGSRREILCPLKDIGYEMSDDGYKLRFSLPKGNYATCLLREFMKSEMRDY